MDRSGTGSASTEGFNREDEDEGGRTDVKDKPRDGWMDIANQGAYIPDGRTRTDPSCSHPLNTRLPPIFIHSSVLTVHLLLSRCPSSSAGIMSLSIRKRLKILLYEFDPTTRLHLGSPLLLQYIWCWLVHWDFIPIDRDTKDRMWTWHYSGDDEDMGSIEGCDCEWHNELNRSFGREWGRTRLKEEYVSYRISLTKKNSFIFLATQFLSRNGKGIVTNLGAIEL